MVKKLGWSDLEQLHSELTSSLVIHSWLLLLIISKLYIGCIIAYLSILQHKEPTVKDGKGSINDP